LEDVEKWYTSEAILSNLVAGGMKEIASISVLEGRDAETLYIGDIKKRGDKGIFRAYDKGKELNLGRNLVTRIELELKREKAHNVAKRLASTNDIAGNFRTHFNVKAQDFERLMDADAVPAVRGKNLVKQAENEALDARWDWLIKQVAPSLKEAIKADRAAGRMDDRLISFMAAAGLLDDARKIASHLSDAKYRDKLHRNELVERKKD
jgi:DNA-binding transcriptional regulator YhcF (GntR family)